MKVEIDELLEKYAKKYKINLSKLIKISLFDIKDLIRKFPQKVELCFGTLSLPFCEYDSKNDSLRIYIFPLYFSNRYTKSKNIEERNSVIRYIFNHELYESLININPSFDFKKYFSVFHFALTSSINSLGLEPCDEALEIYSKEVCSDIRIDTPLLTKEHNQKGFSLIHKINLDVELFKLRDLKITKKENKFFSNIDPNELIYIIISGARKSALSKQLSQPYKLGRFNSYILYHLIGKKIRYPELQRYCYNICTELRKFRPRWNKVYSNAEKFVKNIELKEDL